MSRHFALLQVRSDSHPDDVKKAYRKAVHKYHPDANGGVGNPEMFKEVIKAYREIQADYKVNGIKPVARKSSLVTNIFRAKATVKQRSRTTTKLHRRQIYAQVSVDHILLTMPFEELAIRLRESSNSYVKKQAAIALATSYGVDAIPILREQLSAATESVAEDIIYSLGLIDHAESARLLERFVWGNNMKLACAALNGLRNLSRRHSRSLLRKIENEGRGLISQMSNLLAGSHVKELVKKGLLAASEMYMANAIRRKTSQPLDVILREMGWMIPKAA